MLEFFIFIFGLGIGSFLNVLIDRLPQERTVTGRSKCDHCHKTLEPRDLVPVLSYMFLRGKCRRCHKKLSMQYPLIELLTGLSFLLIWIYTPELSVPLKIAYFGIISSLIVIFVADLKYQIIPDELQLSLFVFSLLMHMFMGAGIQELAVSVISGLVVMLPILVLFILTRGRAMGFGDVKLAFVMGFLLGWVGGLAAVYIAFVVGAIVGVLMILMRTAKLKSHVAFGPFLVFGTVAILFFEKQIFTLLSSLL